MKKLRKEAEKLILDLVTPTTPSGYNGEVYKSLFKEMNDQQFDQFMVKLEAGGKLCIWTDNYDKKHQVNFNNIVKLSRSIGLEPEQQLTYVDQDTGMTLTTPESFVVGSTEARKQRQMLVKKFGAGKDDTMIDDLTGQVYSKSRGTGLSLPEVRVLITMGLPTVATEIYDVKGGDLGALEEYRSSIQETGQASVRGAIARGTGVKSLKSMNKLYLGRHLNNNFGE